MKSTYFAVVATSDTDGECWRCEAQLDGALALAEFAVLDRDHAIDGPATRPDMRAFCQDCFADEHDEEHVLLTALRK